MFALVNTSKMERVLYVIELEDECWYIGESSVKFSERYQMTSLDLRIKQQFGEKIGLCKQSEWCKLHKPIRVEKTVPLGMMTYQQAEVMENALTKIYSEEYGADKVRGGISCLDDDQLKELSADTKDEILGKTTIK